MNQLIELQEVHIHSSWVEVYLIGHKILVDGKKLSKNIFHKSQENKGNTGNFM